MSDKLEVDDDIREAAEKFVKDLKAGKYQRPDKWFKEMGLMNLEKEMTPSKKYREKLEKEIREGIRDEIVVTVCKVAIGLVIGMLIGYGAA